MDFKALAALKTAKRIRTWKTIQDDPPFAQPKAHCRRGQP